jgi:hypothetical protein
MNDCVINELKPNDLKHSWHTYGFKGQSIEGNCQNIHKMYSEKIWDELVSYSSLELPIQDFEKLPHCIKPSQKEVKIGQYDNNTDYFSSWERPTMLLIYQVYQYHRKLKDNLPQYSTDGTRNVWIVKPCYNARGFGIYCTDNVLQEFGQSRT